MNALDNWKALRMYRVEEGSLLFGHISLPDMVVEGVQATKRSHSGSVVIAMYETRTLISSGPFPLGTEEKNPTIL